MVQFGQYMSKNAAALAVAVIAITLGTYDAHAQDRENRGPMGELPGQDPTVAQDPAGRRPPPPDDPTEPDVAKRRRFIWEVHAKRLRGCFAYPEQFQEAAADIPENEKLDLLRQISMILVPGLRPSHPQQVKWYGHWVDNLPPDTTGKIRLTLDVFRAEWSVGDYIVSAGRSRSPSPTNRVGVRVRFPRRPELLFQRMPADFKGYSTDWEFVSKKTIRQFLKEWFDWPSDAQTDFRLHGKMTTCAGVDVYEGTIRPVWLHNGDIPKWSFERVNDGAIFPFSIFITDSDPQYLCVSFDLGSRNLSQR